MRTVRRHGTVPVAVNDVVIVGAGSHSSRCRMPGARGLRWCGWTGPHRSRRRLRARPRLLRAGRDGARPWRVRHHLGHARDGRHSPIIGRGFARRHRPVRSPCHPSHGFRGGACRQQQIDAAACCWFPVPRPPIAGPVLVLDGEASGSVIAHGRPLQRPLLHPKQRVALGGERTANRSAPASLPSRPMSASEPPSSERDLVRSPSQMLSTNAIVRHTST